MERIENKKDLSCTSMKKNLNTHLCLLSFHPFKTFSRCERFFKEKSEST